MRILAIGNIKSGSAVLYLVDKEGRVYPYYSYKIGNNFRPGLTYERF